MKRVLIGSLLVLTLSACQQKIGYVDNSKLLDEYQEKKDLESLFQEFSKQKFKFLNRKLKI